MTWATKAVISIVLVWAETNQDQFPRISWEFSRKACYHRNNMLFQFRYYHWFPCDLFISFKNCLCYVLWYPVPCKCAAVYRNWTSIGLMPSLYPLGHVYWNTLLLKTFRETKTGYSRLKKKAKCLFVQLILFLLDLSWWWNTMRVLYWAENPSMDK